MLDWELYLSTDCGAKACLFVVCDKQLDWALEQLTEEDGLRSAAPRNILPPLRSFMMHCPSLRKSSNLSSGGRLGDLCTQK